MWKKVSVLEIMPFVMVFNKWMNYVFSVTIPVITTAQNVRYFAALTRFQWSISVSYKYPNRAIYFYSNCYLCVCSIHILNFSFCFSFRSSIDSFIIFHISNFDNEMLVTKNVPVECEHFKSLCTANCKAFSIVFNCSFLFNCLLLHCTSTLSLH